MQKAKMAGLKLLTFLAGAATVAAYIAAPVESHSQHRLSLTSPAPPSQQFQCELAPVLDPSGDGLPSAHDLFSSKEAIERQVKRHQAVVRVPSVSYDDLGPFDEDERWKPFYELHRVLEETYPITHARAKLEKINTFGLLYTIQGSDESLQPIILMAHQDVVPVADASTWTHPPFEAVYDGTWIWGRGASDDKNCLTGIMSAVEALLSNKDWTPRRTTLLAFGFDEENSGYLGAGRIAQTILSRYGPDSVAVIVDEGGLNVQTVGDAEYALPAVTEKGYVDVWMELNVAGGHSSQPFPHTGIGIVSEMVSALEAHPYEARLVEDGPVHRHLQCQARYSPDADRELTQLIRDNDLAGVARHLVSLGRAKQYTIQTSQAVDFISGGQKINAMPEQIRVGVNYRVAHHDSIVEVQHNVVKHIAGVVEKYGLEVKAFEDDADYQEYVAGMSPLSSPSSSSDVDYKGTIVLSTQKKSHPAAISPTFGPVWDVFSGTIQHSFGAGNSTVVPIGEIMTGNTDTRHYHELSKHIYRFAPYRYSFEDNIHTVDEHVRVSGHMEGVRFYYDFIRNFDAAKL